MGYRSDIAVQFSNEAIANQFIEHYLTRLAELVEEAKSPTSFLDAGTSTTYCGDYVKDFSMFTRTRRTVTKCGSVVYYWSGFKFYDYFPEVKALTDVLESEQYPAILIRIGDSVEDVDELGYCDGWNEIADPITFVRAIDIPA